MEMKDLGYTYDTTEMGPTSPDKKTKHYPSLRLEKNVPASLMSKDVGDEVELVIKAKIIEKIARTDAKDKRVTISLDVLSMGYEGKPTKKKEVSSGSQSWIDEE